MSRKSTATTPKKSENIIAELNAKLKSLEAKVNVLEERNKSLENKVDIIESKNAVCEKVTNELSKELDKLSQYTRRSNVVIRNVFLPEKESNEDVEKVVKKIIAKDLQLPNEIINIDKLHRIGKVITKNGKKLAEKYDSCGISCYLPFFRPLPP